MAFISFSLLFLLLYLSMITAPANQRVFFAYMVGVLGFEPRTSSLSGTRSNQLSYTPLTSPKSCHPSLRAERRPRDVSPRSLARLNQSSGSFSGIPCGFAVLMPARLDDVCQNRLLPNCPARYFLIFRSRCDNGAPRHIGAARLPPAERRPRNVSPRSLARLNQSSVSLTSVSTKSGAEGARTLDILLAKQVL